MLNKENRPRIIRPDSRMTEGSIEAVRNLFGEIWIFRSHIKIVFKEQFRAAYAGTGLGIFWSYVLPLVPLTVYWALSRLRVFPSFEGVDGATFLTFGVTLWFLLAGCVQMPIQVVQSRNNEAMKTAFPLSASIVSGFAQLLFEALVRCVLVIVVVVATQSWPTWQALMLPVTLLPALLLFVAVGLIFGILNVIYNDVSRVVTILLQYGIFVSGVIFPLYDTGLLSTLNLFNPFAVFIEACRAVVFHGTIENFRAYLAMTGLALIMFVLACRAFFIMEYRIRGIT